MSKCVVRFKDDYVNIPADRIEEHNGMVFVFDGEMLVGVFDLGAVDMVYLSGGQK